MCIIVPFFYLFYLQMEPILMLTIVKRKQILEKMSFSVPGNVLIHCLASTFVEMYIPVYGFKG